MCLIFRYSTRGPVVDEVEVDSDCATATQLSDAEIQAFTRG